MRARSALRAFVAALTLAASTAVVTASAPPAAAAGPRYVTGTYELLAKDHVDAHGGLEHTYTEVLRVPGQAAYPVRLPAGHGLAAGTRIRVAATPTSGRTLDVTSFQRIAPASTVGSPGVTSVLVILAHWNRPDSVTQASATAQFFGDADRWFREVSYGQAGLAGAVTPWVRIAGPGTGCYEDGELLLARAVEAARRLGSKYDSALYQRTVLYFPTCSTPDAYRVAGWAYEPGTVSWLNGSMDRRTTVHEQGHNHGLGHAKSLACRSSTGSRVMFSRSCTTSEYGDPYDAMGRSAYAAHFSGYRKAKAGWLGGSRKRVLATSSATFTLPPFEKPSSLPLVVVVHSPVTTRSYWLEYRRPVGMDARLPTGATGGVLVHVEDTGRRGFLLDASPRDATMSTAVIKPGQTWTAPDYVKIKVGTISSTGARVAVSGARPAPTVPGAPRSVTARPGNSRIALSWAAPASDGRSPILGYDVVATGGEHTLTYNMNAGQLALSLTHLQNGVRYAITVRARNAVGSSPAAATGATPYVVVPTARIVSPAPGAVLANVADVRSEVAVDPGTDSGIRCVDLFVDDDRKQTTCPYTSAGTWPAIFTFDTRPYDNGDHVLSIRVTDLDGRVGYSPPVTVRFDNPHANVEITTPTEGTRYDDTESVTFEATAAMPDGTGYVVSSVDFQDVTDYWPRYIGAATQVAPGRYRLSWDVGIVSGTRRVVAVAHGSNGTTSRSAPVSVTITHPPTTAVVTAPVAGSTVSGTSVRLAADVTVRAAASAVKYVVFRADHGQVAIDYDAPYEAQWDTRNVSGHHSVEVYVVETSGRGTWSPLSTFTVGNVLPVARIAGPTMGTVMYSGTVRLHGTAASGGAGGEAPDRVVVEVAGTTPRTVPVAADGTWELRHDTGTRYGVNYWSARAFTPSGFTSNQQTGYFHLERPRPVVTVETPGPGSTVYTGSIVQVVVSAQPGAGDPAALTSLCVWIGFGSGQWCDYERDADGRFRFHWDVTHRPGTYAMRVDVAYSDYWHTSVDSHSVTVAAPS